MRQVLLPNGRVTTELGFGCAFSDSTREPDALRLLDAAYDAGIRHFDVAPFYLDGRAEVYLGKFLKRHKDVTVATKYGLVPPSQRAVHVRLARAVLGPALRTIRKSEAGSEDKSFYTGATGKARFTGNDARRSFERSLRLLGLEAVDMYLMHSPVQADLEGKGLLDFLERQAVERRIGATGYAGSAEDAATLYRSYTPFCKVVQFNWSAFSPDISFDDALAIHFWVFTASLQKLHRIFAENRDVCREWSEYSNIDLSDFRNLTAVLLKTSLVNNPAGITLFISSNPANIANNVRIAEDNQLVECAIRFREMARSRSLPNFRY